MSLALHLTTEQIFKSAGIFSGLKHVMSVLFSPDYRERRTLLKSQYSEVNAVFDSVRDTIEQIDDAVKTGDSEKYFSLLNQLKSLTDEITKYLNKLNSTVEEIKESSQSLLQDVEVPSLKYVDSVIITPKVRDITKVRLIKALINAGVEESIVDQIIEKDIWKLLEDNIHKNSTIISHETARPSKQREDRDNERWVSIETKPFQVFDFPIMMQISAIVTDMFSRKQSSTRWPVKNIGKILVEKTSTASTKAGSIFKSAQKSPTFINELNAVASRLEVKPEWLIAVMKSESGLNPQAVNPDGGATGLIQFMPSTAEALGTSTEELSNMSDVEQLKYVEKYYSPFKGRMKSPTDLYMATFLPVFVGQQPNTKIGERYNYSNIPRSKLSYHKVYESNKGFDTDEKGYITINDVSKRVLKYLPEAKESIKQAPKSNKPLSSFFEESEPDEELDSGSIIDQIKEIYNFFMKEANNKDNQLIRKAINEAIETNKFIIRISKEDNYIAPYKFANDLSMVLDEVLYVSSDIHHNDKFVDLSFKCAGTQETASLVIYKIARETSKQFHITHSLKPDYKVLYNKDSELKKASEKTVLMNSVKYSLASDETSYSSLMREFGDKEKIEFQKKFKEEFDKAYLSDDDDPYITALSKSIGE